MPTYIIYGDYPDTDEKRCDLKVFDFVEAATPDEAYAMWRHDLSISSSKLPEGAEASVRVALVGPRCFVFDLDTGNKQFAYTL